VQKLILLNTEVIAINQDSTPQGFPLPGLSHGDLSVWARNLSDGSVAVALYNGGDTAQEIGVPSFTALGWPATLRAAVRDLWAHTDNGTAVGKLSNVTVRAHATVVVRLTPATTNAPDVRAMSVRPMLDSDNRPISTWCELNSSVVALAGKTATLTLSPSFTMAGSGETCYGITLGTAGTVLTIEGNGAIFDSNYLAVPQTGGRLLTLGYGEPSSLVLRNITIKNGVGTYRGGGIDIYSGRLSLSDCTFLNNTGSGGALFFHAGSTGLIKGCLFVGPISDGHNDIAREDAAPLANITFACADGEVGTPVQMPGNEITVIPPKELQCYDPTKKYVCHRPGTAPGQCVVTSVGGVSVQDCIEVCT
jgi:hypothetical protein